MFNLFKSIFPSPNRTDGTTTANLNSGEVPTQTEKLSQSTAFKKRGNEYLASGELENAAKCYRQAIEVNPEFAEAYLNLGFVLNEQKLYGDAEQALKQAILLNPKLEDAHYLMGTIAQQQDRFNAAVESFNLALALKPDFEIVYRDLCHALFQSGKIVTAKSVIEKALALNSQNADFHCYQGNL